MHVMIDQSDIWKKLQKRSQEVEDTTLKVLFEDKDRVKNFSITLDELFVDFSKNLITSAILDDLLELAKTAHLEEKREALFTGEKINTTEKRSVLHTALRDLHSEEVLVDDSDVLENIKKVQNKMEVFSDNIRKGVRRGHTGKNFTSIVNIGIGGSDLGPKMATEALRYYSQREMSFYFVSNIDSSAIDETLLRCDPERTLFIIASKTFSTEETMTNAFTAKEWLLNSLKDASAVEKHFVALSTNKDAVESFGISKENIFEFWDFVGGRYSLPSAIGLSLMISIGKDHFKELLEGYERVDSHFKTAPFEKNIPVIMALLGIWNNNFLSMHSQAILPYSEYLRFFPSYLQQLEMESNGKSVTKEGERVTYDTGQVIWGEAGTNGQHTFYQLLHQGTQKIPADFIGFKESLFNRSEHQKKLLAHFIAQTEALAFGKSKDEVESEGIESSLIPHKSFEGNRPSTTFLFQKLTPQSLGMLIALYEHKVFVQGVIWDINSFDQMGVELGKSLAKKIGQEIEEKRVFFKHDMSTQGLIEKVIEK